MVMCFAPNCKHYSEKHPCKFFRFPVNLLLRKRWLKSTRREDKIATPNNQICQCHFKDGKRENGPTIFAHNKDKYFCFSSPEKKHKRQRKNPRPSQLLDHLNSHSASFTMPREIQEVKNVYSTSMYRKILPKCSEPTSTAIPMCSEPTSTAIPICKKPYSTSILKCSKPISIPILKCSESVNVYRHGTFETLQELANLSERILPPWNLIKHDNSAIICCLKCDPAPKIMYSVVIDDSLEMRAYKGDLELNGENGYSFPFSINNIDVLNFVLEFLHNLG